MVNSRNIGNSSVNQARTYYQNDGYVTDVVEQTGRYRKWKDAYSEWFYNETNREAGFDLLCIHESRPPILVQVTTTTPKVHIPFIEFAKTFGHTVRVQQFVRMKGKQKNKVFQYLPDGTKFKMEV